MRLIRDCTCPRCGFKTMASKCRNCGQKLIDDPKTHTDGCWFQVIDSDGTIVMEGVHSDVLKFFEGTKVNPKQYALKGSLVRKRWRIVIADER